MRNNENNNEGVGIVTVIFVVLIAAMGLFLLFSSERHASNMSAAKNSAPTEVAAPVATLHGTHHTP